MDIRKSIFDYSPSLIEYEGNFIRINFDIEQVELENSMDSSEGKKTTRMAYAAHVVRIEHPLERGKIVDAIIFPKLRMERSLMPMIRSMKQSMKLCNHGARRRRL